MSVKKITAYLSTAAVALALVAASSTAYAVSIEVECEVRGDRSRAKVDGADLAADTAFMATIASGGATSTAVMANSDLDGEFDADWDSNAELPENGEPADTSIAVDFIKNDEVTGRIQGTGVDISQTVSCEVKD